MKVLATCNYLVQWETPLGRYIALCINVSLRDAIKLGGLERGYNTIYHNVIWTIIRTLFWLCAIIDFGDLSPDQNWLWRLVSKSGVERKLSVAIYVGKIKFKWRSDQKLPKLYRWIRVLINLCWCNFSVKFISNWWFLPFPEL